MPEEIRRAACDHARLPPPRPPEPRGPSSWGAGPINSSDPGETARSEVGGAGRAVSAASVNAIASEAQERRASESHERGLSRLNLAPVPATSSGRGTSRTHGGGRLLPNRPVLLQDSCHHPNRVLPPCGRAKGCLRYWISCPRIYPTQAGERPICPCNFLLASRLVAAAAGLGHGWRRMG